MWWKRWPWLPASRSPRSYILPPGTRDQRLRRRPHHQRRGGCCNPGNPSPAKSRELQGVIAHEFSHILNGDMRMNLRLMGLIFGILCLSVIGAYCSRCAAEAKTRTHYLYLGLMLLVLGLDRLFLRSAHPGGRKPATRIPGGRFRRAIHPQPRRVGWGPKENRWLALWFEIEKVPRRRASHMFFRKRSMAVLSWV
jgi:hypothetical protein